MADIFYSAAARGFLVRGVHADGAIPADAVAITPAEHAALMDAQAAGRRIVPDADGRPVARDRPPPSLDALAARRCDAVDAERDRRLAAGFPYDALGAVFDADGDAQLHIMSVLTSLAAGQGLPGGAATIDWWDKANRPHALDEATYLAFAAAHRDWVAAVRAAARDTKDAILAAAADDAVPEAERRAAIEGWAVADPAAWPPAAGA